MRHASTRWTTSAILLIATVAMSCGGCDEPLPEKSAFAAVNEDDASGDIGQLDSHLSDSGSSSSEPDASTSGGGSQDAAAPGDVTQPDTAAGGADTAQSNDAASPSSDIASADAATGGKPCTDAAACDDDNPCTVDNCVAGSCAHDTQAKKGAACKSGLKCVVNQTCDGNGVCGGGVFICGCLPANLLYSDVDAKTKNEKSPYWTVKKSGSSIEEALCSKWVSSSNACLGQQFCDTSTDYWACALTPGSNKLKQPCTDLGSKCLVNTCVKDTTSPLAGQCQPTPASTSVTCNDGDSCTTNDLCDGKGACKGTIQLCECTPLNASEKCAYLVGDNKCGGVYCDTSAGQPNYKCKLLPSAEVKCNKSKDTPCARNICNPKKGVCEMTPVTFNAAGLSFSSDGKLCDDNDKCTHSETCKDGKCGDGTVICSCKSDPDCASKEDGDKCNGTMLCDKAAGICKINPATVVTCPSNQDSNCIENICYPSNGACKMTPLENVQNIIFLPPAPGAPPVKLRRPFPYRVNKFVACDDGNACTANDECKNGTCVAGDVFLCDCKKDADCVDDGNICNGKPYCNLATGKCLTNPASKVTCPQPENDDCKVSACSPKTGTCSLKPVAQKNAPCDDGDACTVGDICEKGVCTAGTNTCACSKDSDCASDDKCIGKQFCNKSKGKCEVFPGSGVTCSPSNDTFCRQNRCDPASGTCSMQPVNDFAKCKTGDPCQTDATCKQGACKSNNAGCKCQDDKGCAKFGGACLGGYKCTKGGCVAAKQAQKCAEDGNPCTIEACDPITGKCASSIAPALSACEDGEPCTVDDACNASGSCVAGPNVCVCATDKDCLLETSDKCMGTRICDLSGKIGTCKTKPGSAPVCDNKTGNCTINQCDPKTGACKKDSGACDDGNPCTQDRCILATDKCAHDPVPTGTACGEDSACIVSACVTAPTTKMLYVPAGKAARGCNKQVETCNVTAESPQHLVDLSAFWMQQFEVTVDQYAACVKAGKCSKPGTGAGCTYGKDGFGGRPVNCVSHSQASAYCAQLAPSGRLPTEAEWEKAARGGCELSPNGKCLERASVYVWGKLPAPSCDVTVMKDETGGGCAHTQVKISGKAAMDAPGLPGAVATDLGPYGHYDLAGNVAEWTADGYQMLAYVNFVGAPTKDPVVAPAAKMVARGGNWQADASNLHLFRIAARQALSPGTDSANLGFRCALSAKDTTSTGAKLVYPQFDKQETMYDGKVNAAPNICSFGAKGALACDVPYNGANGGVTGWAKAFGEPSSMNIENGAIYWELHPDATKTLTKAGIDTRLDWSWSFHAMSGAGKVINPSAARLRSMPGNANNNLGFERASLYLQPGNSKQVNIGDAWFTKGFFYGDIVLRMKLDWANAKKTHLEWKLMAKVTSSVNKNQQTWEQLEKQSSYKDSFHWVKAITVGKPSDPTALRYVQQLSFRLYANSKGNDIAVKTLKMWYGKSAH